MVEGWKKLKMRGRKKEESKRKRTKRQDSGS